MQLSRIDLNLFTVFDAIYREGGITPASKKLHLSQPAVSHALARLREILEDPLFERRGNDMIPTPLAREFAVTVASSLGSLEQMLQRSGHFDPATTGRRFTVAVREAHETALLPALLAAIHKEKAKVEIAAVRIERRDLEEDLQSGELDAAIDVALPLSQEVRRASLNSEPLVVLARKRHPAIKGKLDLATYLAAEHVLVTGRRHGGGFEDLVLGRMGVSRRIRLRCQQHAAANDVVSRTDLLVTMSRGQAALVNREQLNRVMPFPAEIPALESFLYWHASVDNDPANRWFRDQLTRALTGAEKEGPQKHKKD
jgi:DNA-binding transcriptional LysR family regulator